MSINNYELIINNCGRRSLFRYFLLFRVWVSHPFVIARNKVTWQSSRRRISLSLDSHGATFVASRNDIRNIPLLFYYSTLSQESFKHFGGITAHFGARSRLVIFGSAIIGDG